MTRTGGGGFVSTFASRLLALEESGPGGASTASAVSFTPNGSIAATNVQAAIQEVRDEATGSPAASAVTFTPNGSIAATNVQAAIQEVRDEAGAAAGSWFNVTDYGAIGDNNTANAAANVTAFQDAIDDATQQAGGGVVIVPAGNYYINASIEMKAGVHLVGEGEAGAGYPAGTAYGPVRIRATSGFTGFMIETSASTFNIFGVRSLTLQGPGTGTANGGIHIRNQKWIWIKDVGFNNFGDQAVLQDAGNSLVMEDCIAFNCLLTRTGRSADVGVVDLSGNDPFMTRCEISASGTALHDAQQNICAIRINTVNGFFTDCVGEISDTGWSISGQTNRFVNCRGDLNWGDGFRITNSQNQFAACAAVSNGRETTNTFYGFNTSAGANLFSGCLVVDYITNVVKHGFYDTSTGSAIDARNIYVGCLSRGHGTEPGINTVATGNSAGVIHAPMTFSAADATAVPAIGGTSLLKLPYTTNTTITNFSGGTNGQTLRVVATSSGTVTIADNATINTSTGANKALTTNLVYSFTLIDGVWLEAA
jgi:hypothetical protein